MENLKAEETVYIRRFTGYGYSYSKATVAKVTPKGFTDIVIGSGSLVRFRPDGKEVGDRFRGWEIERDKTVEERDALRAQEERKNKARWAVCDLKVGGVGDGSGKEDLLKVIEKLETDIIAARILVEAI